MATSTQPKVLNLLVQKLNGLLPFALTTGSEPVYIFDGVPTSGPNNIVAVMPLPGDESHGREIWRDTAGGRIEEYSVQVIVRSYVGGASDPNSLSTAQTAARANAAIIQAAIEASLLSDLTLANENGNAQAIIQFGGGDSDLPPWEVSYSQTNTDDDDGKGRYAAFTMILNIYNYLDGAG